VLLLTLTTLASVVPAHAQSPVYAGGSMAFVTQTGSTFEPNLGGTTWGGSVLVGVEVSPRFRVEFESSFSGAFEGEFTYRPIRFLTARVVTRRRDTFFAGQLRARTGFLEPVVGLSYVHGRGSRRATIVETGGSYFDDDWTDHTLALALGLDAGIAVAPRLFFVPTFRLFAVVRPTSDVIGRDIRGGSFVFRYGAGARITF
jgi:hypothetical protein